MSKPHWQGVFEAHTKLIDLLDQTASKAIRKNYRADRTKVFVFAHRLSVEEQMRLNRDKSEVLFSNPYDTKENRFVKHLLSSLEIQLAEFKNDVAEASLNEMLTELHRVQSYPCWQVDFERVERVKRVEKRESVVLADVHGFPEAYRKIYHAYVILKYALCEWEADRYSGLSFVNWAEADVLVGSFGSEAQWKHNLAKKYYYAPERYFDPTCFPIRYIALYQSSHFSETGIRYYGEVKDIRCVQRKKIRFSVQRNNGEEGYYVFRVKRWKSLANPIAIRDEGVFAPKFTNLFLLLHAKESYELFHVRTEQQYRVLQQIRRILRHASEQIDWKEYYPIEGGKAVWVHDGMFELLDEQEKPMRLISVLDFMQHPTTYLDDLFACISCVPKENDVPLWLKRENDAYLERYGKPYSDE